MTKKIFHFSLYFLALFLILSAVFATIISYILKDLKYYTELSLKHLEKNTGYTVSITDITWDILKGTGIKIDDLQITDSRDQAPLFISKKVQILFELLPLFEKKLKISKIILNDPEIVIFRDNNRILNIFTGPDVQFKNTTQDGKSFDFIISLKSFYINNGKFILRDNLLSVMTEFDHVNLNARMNRKTKKFNVSAYAEHNYKSNKGFIDIQGDFSFLSGNVDVRNSYANGNIKLKTMSIAELMPYITNEINFPENNALFDANFNFSIQPGWKFYANGKIESKGLSGTLKNKKPFYIDPCKLSFIINADPSSLNFDKLELFLPENNNIDAKLYLTNLHEQLPRFDLKIKSGRFKIVNLVKLANDTGMLTDNSTNLLNKITYGEILLNNIRLHGDFKNISTEKMPALYGEIEIKNMSVNVFDQINPIRILDSRFEVHSNTMLGIATANWLTDDTHTANFEITSIFDKPSLNISILSTLPSNSLNDFMPLLTDNSSSEVSFKSTTGFVTGKTTISICEKLKFTSEIDMTSTAYGIPDLLMKPAGTSNKFYLEGESGENMSTPLPFSFEISLGKDKMLLKGIIKNTASHAVEGLFSSSGFDITSFDFPGLPHAMLINGKVSGNGSFTYPPLPGSKFPFKGSISIDNFNLTQENSDQPLISTSINTKIDDNEIYVRNGSGRIGVSNFKVSGKLTELMPPQGTLSVDAGLFDIDDCVITVQSIIKAFKQQNKKSSSSDKSLFRQTSLDINLKPKKTNFLQWDFGRANSLFSIKNGKMLWDNININAGNGFIKGAVLYDLSNIEKMELRFMPSSSSVDFLWCVSGLKKSKIITGTLNLSGEFSSYFDKEKDILPNMTGKFHVSLKNGKIRKFTVLSKIFSMLNIERLITLQKTSIFSKGMPFESIEADFIMENSEMKTDNFFLKSPAMNLSAVGSINPITKEIDLTVGTQPLENIANILSNIPLAKDILTSKDKSMTVFYFHVKGPFEDASVTPMPFKSLSSAVIKVFKSIFNIPLKMIPNKSDNSSE